MHPLIRPFLDICLLRLRPQDLPDSGLLLAIALFAHTLTGVALSVLTLAPGSALLAGIMDTALLATLTVALLSLQRLGTRTVRTLTALAGSGAIIGLVAIPVTGWLHGVAQDSGEAGIAALALLGLVGWSIAVVGHVLRHALSVSFALGLVIAVCFYWISINALNAVFRFGG